MKIASTQYTLSNNAFEIYISGCNKKEKCKKCYNPELWNFDIGEIYNKEYFDKLFKKITRFNNIIDKIFIIGGEPLDQNKDDFLLFLNDLKLLNTKMWLFTRYNLEDIDTNIKLFFDYIKTGEYKSELKINSHIKYEIKLATSNQNIYKKGLDY
jgi:anaerobic ribonucleoside-triphosphate reductase activating protein